MKKYLAMLAVLVASHLCALGQEKKEQHRPYTDLRPLHFGIMVGTNFQDIEMENVGPQTITMADGSVVQQTIVCDADKWNPGISVGVLADLRLSNHFNLRFSPAMHFGGKHLTFSVLSNPDENGKPREETQDLKNTYISFPVNLKFSALRCNNHRPYVMAGINPMINLTSKDQDLIQLKRYDTYFEIGVGCDFYLPFFKLIPELKFCYGLTNSLDKNHVNDLRDETMKAYAGSVRSCHTKMIVLSFYFE